MVGCFFSASDLSTAVPVGLSVAFSGGEVTLLEEIIPVTQNQSSKGSAKFPIYLINKRLLSTYHAAWHYQPGLETKQDLVPDRHRCLSQGY